MGSARFPCALSMRRLVTGHVLQILPSRRVPTTCDLSLHTSCIALAAAFEVYFVFLRLVELLVVQHVLIAYGFVSAKGGFVVHVQAHRNDDPDQVHLLILLLHRLKAGRTPTDRYYVFRWEGETYEDDEILQVQAASATRPTN